MEPQKPYPPSVGNEVPKDPAATPAPVVTAMVDPSPQPVTPPAWTPNTVGPVGPQPMPASVMGTPRPKKKGLLIGLLIGLLVIVLGGSAAAAYFGVVVPNKPENVLKTALANSFAADNITSEHFTGSVSVTEKKNNQTVSGDFSGSANTDGAFEIKANVDAIVTKVTMDMRSVDGKSMYVKVGGLEGLPELMNASGDDMAMLYAPIVAGLNEQWIEINESILSQMGVSSTSFKMTDADRQKMAQAYADHQFMVFKEQLKSEKIASTDSYHYKVVIDKTQLNDFIKALKDAKLDSLKLTQNDVDRMRAALKEVDFNKYPVDLWVSKADKMINQIKFIYSDNEAAMSFRLTVTDYNKPVTVEKPAGAKSLLQIISQLFGGSMDSSTFMQELEGSGISL